MISMYSASLGSEKIGCIVSNWHVDCLIDWLIDWCFSGSIPFSY